MRRVVFGSSNHAVGFYPRSQRVDVTVLPRPDSRYGLSKCWGEAVGSLYADKYAVKSLHIRIGNAADLPGNARSLAIWVSGRDLAQLCIIGLEHPEIHNTIVYGVSDNFACWYDNSEAYRLGYKPQDHAEDHKDFAMAEEAKLTARRAGALLPGRRLLLDRVCRRRHPVRRETSPKPELCQGLTLRKASDLTFSRSSRNDPPCASPTSASPPSRSAIRRCSTWRAARALGAAQHHRGGDR